MAKVIPSHFYKYLSNANEYLDDCLDNAIFAGRFYFSKFETLDDPSERTIVPDRLEGEDLKRVVIDNINENKLWKPLGLDRPLDYTFTDFEAINVARPEDLQEQMIEIARNLSRNASVYCMSRRWDNAAVWSQYSNNARGICLELSYNQRGPILPNLVGVVSPNPPHEVSYVEHPPTLGLRDVLQFASSFNIMGMNESEIEKRKRRVKDFVTKLHCTKSIEWSFQTEWRSVNVADGYGYQPISNLRVDGILFGRSVEPIFRERILKKYGQTVKCYQIQQAAAGYNLERVLLT